MRLRPLKFYARGAIPRSPPSCSASDVHVNSSVPRGVFGSPLRVHGSFGWGFNWKTYAFFRTTPFKRRSHNALATRTKNRRKPTISRARPKHDFGILRTRESSWLIVIILFREPYRRAGGAHRIHKPHPGLWLCLYVEMPCFCNRFVCFRRVFTAERRRRGWGQTDNVRFGRNQTRNIDFTRNATGYPAGLELGRKVLLAEIKK